MCVGGGGPDGAVGTRFLRIKSVTGRVTSATAQDLKIPGTHLTFRLPPALTLERLHRSRCKLVHPGRCQPGREFVLQIEVGDPGPCSLGLTRALGP